MNNEALINQHHFWNGVKEKERDEKRRQTCSTALSKGTDDTDKDASPIVMLQLHSFMERENQLINGRQKEPYIYVCILTLRVFLLPWFSQ